jgi:hypothetical protein
LVRFLNNSLSIDFYYYNYYKGALASSLIVFNPKKQVNIDFKLNNIESFLNELKEKYILKSNYQREKYVLSSASNDKLEATLNEIIGLISNDFILVWLQDLTFEKDYLKIIIKLISILYKCANNFCKINPILFKVMRFDRLFQF